MIASVQLVYWSKGCKKFGRALLFVSFVGEEGRECKQKGLFLFCYFLQFVSGILNVCLNGALLLCVFSWFLMSNGLLLYLS
jgi:hypothetical protein